MFLFGRMASTSTSRPETYLSSVLTVQEPTSIEKYFTINNNTKEATCKVEQWINDEQEKLICGQKIKNAKMFNMKRHLERNHHAEFKNIELNDKKSKRKSSDAPPIEKKKTKQTVLDSFVVSNKVTVQADENSVKMGIIKMVVNDGISFTTFSREGFNLATGGLCKKLGINTSNEYIRKMIIDFAQKKKNELKCVLKNKLIYLQIDAATRHQKNYLGINTQFFHNGQIQVKTLSLIDTLGRHKSYDIKVMVEKSLEEFEITKEQLLGVSVDNAANMTHAINILNDDCEYLEEELESCISNQNDSESEIMEEESSAVNEAEENATIWENNPHMILPEWCQESVDIELMRCVIHTLQLAIREGMKEKTISNLLGKVRFVVKKLRNTHTMSVARKQFKVVPILDNDTRWGSTYLMLKRLIHLRPLCEQLSLANNVFNLQPEVWNKLEKLKIILEKPYDVTVKLQSANITPGEFLKEWSKLKRDLENIKDQLAEDIKNSMNRREEKLFKNNIFLAGVYVDPRYRILLKPSDIESAKDGLMKVAKKIYMINQQSAANKSNVTNLQKSPEKEMLIQSDSSEDDFEKELNEKEKKRTQTIFAKEDEFKSRFKINCDIIEEKGRFKVNNVFSGIEQYPEDIREPCRIVSCLPISQASVERTFSALKFICSDLRSQLKNDILDCIIFLRMNQDFD